MPSSVTPYLCCDGAAEAIEFYNAAFGAEELSRMTGDDGRISHADLRIGETLVFLSDEWTEAGIRSPRNLGGRCASFVINVDDADAAFARAVEAGCKVERPVKQEGFGRIGWLHDPWGHHWALFTERKPA